MIHHPARMSPMSAPPMLAYRHFAMAVTGL